MIRILNTQYRIEGLEPTGDPLWKSASPAIRLELWTEAGRIGEQAKQAELAGGLDRFGHKLLRVGPACWLRHRHSVFTPQIRPVPDDAAHPPLMPGGAASRTRAWLTWKADERGVTFYWKNGWGRQLARHRDGHRAYIRACHRIVQVKPRDVIGLSVSYETIVAQGVAMWWQVNRFRVQAAKLVRVQPTRGEFDLDEEEIETITRGGLLKFQVGTTGPARLVRDLKPVKHLLRDVDARMTVVVPGKGPPPPPKPPPPAPVPKPWTPKPIPGFAVVPEPPAAVPVGVFRRVVRSVVSPFIAAAKKTAAFFGRLWRKPRPA